jgi:hypothetical protein
LFPSVGYWLAARIGKFAPGITPLAEFWSEWRLSTQWPISTSLVLGGRDDEAIELLKWLYAKPTVRTIQGDSAAEGMVFLYAAIDQLPQEYRKLYLSRCLIASSPEATRALGNSPSPLIIIIEASEPGLATRLAQQRHHVLVTYGSGVGTSDIVNVLSRPHFKPFQEARNRICTIRFVPLLIRGNHLTFLVHVLAVFRCRMMIEKAHEGAIRHKRDNAVRFVAGELQATNPDEYDDQSQSQHSHAKAVNTSGSCVKASYSRNA